MPKAAVLLYSKSYFDKALSAKLKRTRDKGGRSAECLVV